MLDWLQWQTQFIACRSNAGCPAEFNPSFAGRSLNQIQNEGSHCEKRNKRGITVNMHRWGFVDPFSWENKNKNIRRKKKKEKDRVRPFFKAKALRGLGAGVVTLQPDPGTVESKSKLTIHVNPQTKQFSLSYNHVHSCCIMKVLRGSIDQRSIESHLIFSDFGSITTFDRFGTIGSTSNLE